MKALYTPQEHTGHVELHPNPFLGTLQLASWLFGHPSAWRSYITEIAPDLESNFCLLELKAHHWRNPDIRQILVSAFLILPLVVTLISYTWLSLTGQSEMDVFRGTVISFEYYLFSCILISLVHSVSMGIGFGMVLGLFISIPDHMGGILYAVLLASGLGGQLAVTTAPDHAPRSPRSQILAAGQGVAAILLMILSGYVVVSGTLTGTPGNAQLGQGMPWQSGLAFGVGSGLIGGAAYATITRLRVNEARSALLMGVGLGVLCTVGYTGSLSIPHSNPIIHVFGGTTGAFLFTALFLLPYTLVARAGGPWAGAISGGLACGMAWLPIYDFVIFESSGRNILMDIPFGQVLVAAIILAGLTVHYWLPVLVFPFYYFWNQLLYQRDRIILPEGNSLLKFNSVFWDEFQYLRLIGLDKHLVLVYETKPELGQHLMHVISSSHQRWAVQRARVELDARQLERLETVEQIAQAHQILASSETMVDPANIILNLFSLISQDTQVALNHATIFHRRLGLKAIAERLNGLMRDLSRSGDPYAVRFYRVAVQWLKILQRSIAEMEKNVEDSGEIDNPYIVGVPLTEQQKIFVGRSDIALRLEQWLSDQRCPPLFLYGQRRMGKTSLLLNLGRLIHGGILPLFVDGQYVTSGDNYREIILNMARACQRSASRTRNILLPPLTSADLSDNAVIEFNAWLDQIENLLHEQGFNTALLALDEFDAFFYAAQIGRYDETDFLNLLRYMVQHRPYFKVLLTSARSPDEFGDWASHLINLQVIHLGALKPEEARQLIERPTQDFKLVYTPEASQRVMELSGGHPYLLQLLCYEIIILKNSQPQPERRTARLEDIHAAIQPALKSGQFFFEEIQRQGFDDLGRSILKQVAAAGEGAIVPEANLPQADPNAVAEQMRRLLQREVLEEVEPGAYRFRIELVRQWFVR